MDIKTLVQILGGGLILVAFLVLIFGKSKKSILATKVLGLIGVVFVAVLFIPGIANTIPFLGNPLAAGVSVDTQVTGAVSQQTPSGICAVEDTTVAWLGSNFFTGAATGGTHRYMIKPSGSNGFGPARTIADAGTATISPGDTIRTLWMNASTTGAYIPDISEVTIPCSGTFDLTKSLYQNGTISLQVFNQEGNVIDGGATENETLAADDVATLKFELRGTSKRGLPHGGVLIFEANTTAIDITNTEITLDGVTLTRVDVPAVHVLNATSNKAIAFSVGDIIGGVLKSGTIVIDAASAVQNVGQNEPTLYFRPNSYYIDEDNAGAFAGPSVADEDDAATYAHISSFVIHTD